MLEDTGAEEVPSRRDAWRRDLLVCGGAHRVDTELVRDDFGSIGHLAAEAVGSVDDVQIAPLPRLTGQP